jgi:hypothetical protein
MTIVSLLNYFDQFNIKVLLHQVNLLILIESVKFVFSYIPLLEYEYEDLNFNPNNPLEIIKLIHFRRNIVSPNGSPPIVKKQYHIKEVTLQVYLVTHEIIIVTTRKEHIYGLIYPFMSDHNKIGKEEN